MNLILYLLSLIATRVLSGPICCRCTEKAIYSYMLWINEGFVLDEAGNMIAMLYVDLRTPESRAAIQTLVKGCRREHAVKRQKIGTGTTRIWH